MQALVAASTAERRFAMILFEAFALVSLALAALGVYGVVAGAVAERTKEIGLRSALGASRGRILAEVAGRGAALTGIGVAVGLGAAATASRAVVSLLYGVSPLDALTYVGVSALLVAVAGIACWLPASRAARVDPAVALRTE
jgi:ABC-type antimicrobial peptide transport system permease subunit